MDEVIRVTDAGRKRLFQGQIALKRVAKRWSPFNGMDYHWKRNNYDLEMTSDFWSAYFLPTLKLKGWIKLW